MSDPIKQALSEVEVGEASEEIGETVPGEEEAARPEGPLPEEETTDEPDDSGFSVLSWARSVPDGSHRDFDATDWWDPDGGAENRLAFHLADATGAGAGYPNGLGVLVALAELYWAAVKDQQGGGSESDDDGGDVPDAETVPAETAEALV